MEFAADRARARRSGSQKRRKPMNRALWLANCTLGMTVALVSLVGNAHGRGGREGGGGFSRESPAASGGFSSHAGSAQERQGRAQSSREQTATGMQSSAQQYRGSYPYAASHPAWDAGAGFAAATTGAAIGAAVVSSTAHAQMYVASPPCAAPTIVPVGSMKYFGCGSSWYTQGYGPNGPTLVAVPPPPGY